VLDNRMVLHIGPPTVRVLPAEVFLTPKRRPIVIDCVCVFAWSVPLCCVCECVCAFVWVYACVCACVCNNNNDDIIIVKCVLIFLVL